MVAKTQIRVAWDECDPDGMVHVVNYYRWMDQALHALMLEVGFGHRAILEKFGGYVPAVEASARCTVPLRFDDQVTIEAEIANWSKRSFRVEYRGYRGSRLVFEGMEVRVWATIEDGKARSAAIPDPFREALSELAGAPAV